MSCDKLVYDLSQEIEGSPNVFIRKDWLNILDNQNQNYQSNQSIIDTSQLSNSNKYLSYREAYLAVPMLLSVSTGNPEAAYTLGDSSIGLKNWFGTIIHSFTLDYNGTTIIQQTPFCNMWNSFKLLTTLSWEDVRTQGPTIGFYPDTAGAIYVADGASFSGIEVCNNACSFFDTPSSANLNNNRYNQIYQDGLVRGGNCGLYKRIQNIAFNTTNYSTNLTTIVPLPAGQYQGISLSNCSNSWRTNISSKLAGANNVPATLQISIMATIYLKHVHSFFNMVPLLKGAFMKMTMNLNNASTTAELEIQSVVFNSYAPSVPTGGVNPIMIPAIGYGTVPAAATAAPATWSYDLSVGSRALTAPVYGANRWLEGNVSKSIYLYVPAYTFNNPFEQAYLSSPIKQIKYTDIYQYQISTGIEPGNSFNNLITNGIANIKSVLIIPFWKNKISNDAAYEEFRSPFDPAGTGCTAPLVQLGNFNVQISGQNAIYNTQRYTFEQFNNQLYGQNAVNGGLTDGLTSGLINFTDFQLSQCFYYVNVERMLPVEQSVPKSVQIIGTNLSTQALQLWVFVEYGVEVSIDILTGARV